MSLLVLLDSGVGVTEETVSVADSVTASDPPLHLGFPISGIDTVGVLDNPPPLRVGFIQADINLLNDPYLHLGFPIAGVDTVGVANPEPTRLVNKLVDDSVTLADAHSAAIQLAIRDLLDASDRAVVRPGVTLADAITVEDAVTKSVLALLQDGLDAIDRVVSGSHKVIVDTATVQDEIQRAIGVIQGDSVTSSDRTGRDVNIGVSDSTIASDFIVKLAGFALIDPIAITEKVLKTVGVIMSDENIITEFADGAFAKQIEDENTIVDAIRIAVAMVIANSVIVTEHVTLDVDGQTLQTVADLANVTDRILLHVRALLGGDITADDAKHLHPSIQIVDPMAVLDRSVTQQPRHILDMVTAHTKPGVAAFLRTVDDVPVADFRLAGHHVELIDNVIGDDFTPKRAVALIMTDVADVLDRVAKATSLRLSDTIAGLDTIVVGPGIFVPDGVEVTDFARRDAGGTKFVQVADLVGVTTPPQNLSVRELIADQLASTDTVLPIRHILEAVFDELSITDEALRARTFDVVLTDTVTAQAQQVSLAVDRLIRDAVHTTGFSFNSADVSVLIRGLQFTAETLRTTGFVDESVRVTKMVDDILSVQSTGFTKGKLTTD